MDVTDRISFNDNDNDTDKLPKDGPFGVMKGGLHSRDYNFREFQYFSDVDKSVMEKVWRGDRESAILYIPAANVLLRLEHDLVRGDSNDGRKYGFTIQRISLGTTESAQEKKGAKRTSPPKTGRSVLATVCIFLFLAVVVAGQVVTWLKLNETNGNVVAKNNNDVMNKLKAKLGETDDNVIVQLERQLDETIGAVTESSSTIKSYQDNVVATNYAVESFNKELGKTILDVPKFMEQAKSDFDTALVAMQKSLDAIDAGKLTTAKDTATNIQTLLDGQYRLTARLGEMTDDITKIDTAINNIKTTLYPKDDPQKGLANDLNMIVSDIKEVNGILNAEFVDKANQLVGSLGTAKTTTDEIDQWYIDITNNFTTLKSNQLDGVNDRFVESKAKYDAMVKSINDVENTLLDKAADKHQALTQLEALLKKVNNEYDRLFGQPTMMTSEEESTFTKRWNSTWQQNVQSMLNELKKGYIIIKKPEPKKLEESSTSPQPQPGG